MGGRAAGTLSMKPDELVLCSPIADLPVEWLPEAGALALDEEAFLDRLKRVAARWVSRRQAEESPQFKQWIPYVLLRSRQGELAAYPRQGTESRIHGLWSLGVGGHINPEDAEPSITSEINWRATIWRGMQRELREEYPSAAVGRTRFLGLIHEARTVVGTVHLGVVFLHEPDDCAEPPGAELRGLRWIPGTALGSEAWPARRFELWSQLALQLL